MIDHLALGIVSTGSWARILALHINARFFWGTVRVDEAFWSA